VTARTATRARIARRQASVLGLRTVQRGQLLELRDGDQTVFVGRIDAVESFLAERFTPRRPGPPRGRTPTAWQQPIDSYCLHLSASGATTSTIASRRSALARMGRELRRAPYDVTAEQIVEWFGRQDWQPATRRFYRAAARSFYRWAYRAGHVATYIPDEIPTVRERPPAPRPVTDDAWHHAIAAADPRVTVMLRLAAEAGLRRSEVAQVHTRDVVDGVGGAQLVVHGKGDKIRFVPISDALAAVLRAGAAGHTPGMPTPGWLFPTGVGGHLTPDHVAELVVRVLPDGWSMHKLRHRFATRAYRGSRNLRAVQALLGHASIATTERYTAVDDDEIRAAMMFALDGS
jgi:integrase/recombinase XerC